MSIEKLTDTIIESARAKAKEISDKYEQEIEKIKQMTNEQIRQLTQENNEKLSQQQLLIRTQMISNAELFSQQEVLKAKWSIIDDIFKKAQEKFIASNDYLNFIKEKIERYSNDDSEIIVSKRDMMTLSKLYPNKKLIIDNNLNNGLIIKKGRVELNYSLDRIINSLKTELVIELSQLLFE